MAKRALFVTFISLLLLLFVSGVLSATFTIINKCGQTVWPGVLSSAGISPLDTTGFVLEKDESKALNVPTSWSGRLWGRTHCTQDSTGKFTCISGDCGSGKLECAGAGAAPPATLAEFTLNGAGGLDFYDVSLVDGYNLPMLVVAEGGTGGNCSTTGCVVDLNGVCPNDLKVLSEDGSHVACKSACGAFGDPQYCCSGAYGNPNTCKPSSYSEFFKNACPRAYSYAYDDGTSTFTCASANYVITFCPSLSTSKKATKNPEAADLPLFNTTMIFLGGEDVSGASSTTRVAHVQFIGGAVAVLSLVGIPPYNLEVLGSKFLGCSITIE
ncbi:Thaumatin [Macleaya cordata]|uniref:Thaumatin n=1 Tax=Macleaya cordata TaxID=56857 RepID=A0A200RA86_MACCD|nr:Thaumatin [Macleaya cordata]